MSELELKQAIEGLGSAFDEFKKANDERLKEVEKKGSADSLTEEKLNRINDAITAQEEMKAKIEKLETSTAADFADSEKSGNAEEMELKEAFLTFLTKGTEGMSDMEKKTLSSASDPDGGYTVQSVLSDRIIKKVFETSPMRQVADVQTIGTDRFEFIVDNDESSSGWVSESGTRSATNTPTLDKKAIDVFEVYALPKATTRILDDSSIDIEGWLAEKVASEIARKENTAFITGDGVGKPRGILDYTAGTSWGQIEQISSTSGTGGTLSADDIFELYYGVKAEYQMNGAFLMSRGTIKKTRQLKGTDNNYLWVPGLAKGDVSTLNGAPVIQADDMPTIATNSLSIAFGDFNRGYQIVDRQGVRVLRDPYSTKGFVEFYVTKRVGGGVTNFEAIKLLKMDA